MDTRVAISFDTETHLFRPGSMAPPVVCLSSASVAEGVELRDAHAGSVWLAGKLEEAIAKRAVVIGHNVGYDFACLLDRDPSFFLGPLIWRAYDAKGIHCTKTRERLIDIARGSRFAVDEEGSVYRKGHSLADISKARLGIEMDKDTWRTNYEQLDGIPIEKWPQGARDYAMGDADATLAVWATQEEEIDRDFPHYKLWSAEVGRQSAFAFALQLMKCRGIMVDQPRVRELRSRLGDKMVNGLEVLRAAGLIDPKKGSKKMEAIRDAVLRSWRGDGDVPRTPKGAISTAADTLEQCTDPALVTLVEYAHAEKILSTFVSKLEAAGELPIHADTDCLGADSGRTSCRGPNLQQQPREPGVRECFRARDGMVLIACDYDSQELRALAQVLVNMVGKSALAVRYQDDPDYDPHTDFAATLLGVSYEEALAAKRAKDPKVIDWRQRAKAANFGFPGGMGAEKFTLYARGYGLDLDLGQANQLRDQWFRQWPEMRRYFDIIGKLTETGDAEIQQEFSGRLRGRCPFPAAANTKFQGLGADITKSALWEVTKRSYGAPGTEGSALLGCRPVIFVHDELIIEAPQEYAHEAAVELDRVMCEAMQELTPDVPARASPALMRNWSKKADAAFDGAGRYIAWEDRPKEKEKAA